MWKRQHNIPIERQEVPRTLAWAPVTSLLEKGSSKNRAADSRLTNSTARSFQGNLLSILLTFLATFHNWSLLNSRHSQIDVPSVNWTIYNSLNTSFCLQGRGASQSVMLHIFHMDIRLILVHFARLVKPRIYISISMLVVLPCYG